MTPTPRGPPPATPTAIALRVGVLIVIVVLATWAAHAVRDALDLTIMPSNEKQVHRLLMFGTGAYVCLLAIPFVPSAEIGIARLTAVGAALAPLVYMATISAMMLSYGVGRLLPRQTRVRVLSLSRLRRTSDLAARAAPMAPEAHLAMLLDNAPPRTVGLASRHRFVALGLIVNAPGNVVIGGGGGIMLLAGLSRI